MKFLKIVYFCIVCLIIGMGVFFRSFFYYPFHRDFWADEMRLANNLFEKGYWGLFSNLIEDQASPPFFFNYFKSNPKFRIGFGIIIALFAVCLCHSFDFSFL